MTDHKNHTKETIYNDANMKHGTNINITNTVYKKKKANTSPPRLHKNNYFVYAE